MEQVFQLIGLRLESKNGILGGEIIIGLIRTMLRNTDPD